MNPPELFADLEYTRLAHQAQNRCHSDLGRKLAADLKPLEKKEEIEASLALVSELQECLEMGLDKDFSELSDLQPLFTEARHALFGFEEFFQVWQNARLATILAESVPNRDDFPRLGRLWGRVLPLKWICQRFDVTFGPEGEVLDSASPELARIRKREAALQRSIQKTMQSMLNDPRMEGNLQDRFITQREGRYVLPVRESAAPNVPGIVQSQSGSGSTLFIEPQAAVPLNNELQLLKQEEKREIHRIFTEFTAQIKAQERELLQNQKLMSELDFRYGCARLCDALDAKVPIIVQKPVLKLIGARHPLLILSLGTPKKVVPYDLELGEEANVILLSGPNTGGKTVLMKSAGLLTLMALSGLPIPADADSEIGIFHQVFADIGDDQSIENALSTFSSHLRKIARMLDLADANSLVLIDEIGAATDPQQGSALAQAILERFTALDCKAIVTTHYTTLKIFAETHPKCQNASMQFDLKNLQPTFRFSTGIPGDSFAIEVAASLGLEPKLVERAKSLSGTQNLEFTELLKKMQEEKKELGRATYEYQLKTRNLEARIKELEERDSKLEEELRQRRQKFIRELQTELIAQQKLYQKEQEHLKQLDREERKALSERKLHELTDKLQQIRSELAEAGISAHKPARGIKPGDRVWLASFEAEARVLEIQGENASVDMNGISFRVPTSELFEAEDKPDEKPPVNAPRVTAMPKAWLEIMVRGLTFDEARPMIDEFLDDAYLAGLHSLRIIHGKGTGVLRDKVRKYLKKKEMVISMETAPPNEGGTGVTVVKI